MAAMDRRAPPIAHGGLTSLLGDETFYDALARRGMDRRTFLGFCGAVAAVLGLPAVASRAIADELQRKKRVPVVWLELQDCAGCTESFLRAARPSVDDVILDALSLDYHETLMAAAGHQAEALRDRTVAQHRGAYLALVEGAIPVGADGAYCTIGGRSAIDIVREVCGGALATIAVGSCAAFGGLPGAAPNPTGAISVQAAVPQATVVNMPGCPMNPSNLTALIVHYLTFGRFPALDARDRPLFAYGKVVHDHCERRAHFEAGRFSERFGDEAHRQGHCLYRLGCKGPTTAANCPTIRWNDGMGWPIGAGHPCLGCTEPGFWDRNTPFYERLPDVSALGVQARADRLGLGVVAATGAGITAYGIARAIARRLRVVEPRQEPAATAQPAPEERRS